MGGYMVGGDVAAQSADSIIITTLPLTCRLTILARPILNASIGETVSIAMRSAPLNQRLMHSCIDCYVSIG